MRFLDVVARGDTVGVPALFTDDAVVLGAPPCSVTAFCKGPAAIAKFVEAAAAVHQKPTLIGTPQVAGNLIFLRYEVRNDTVSKAGVERYIILANTIVFGDKLDAYAAQNDLSDAQTVKYQTYVQQQAQASASAAARTDPAAVVQRYYDALNRGDANAAMAVFTNKAVNITGNCALRAPCTTTADILKGIQTVIAGHIKVTQGDPLVAGNLVQFHSENRSDAAAEAGVGSFRAFETWTLAGDKAVGRINLFDLSDAQTVKYQLYVQQQAQASASAAAGSAAAKPAAAPASAQSGSY
jgi:ketosteroid isomerase-like protein